MAATSTFSIPRESGSPQLQASSGQSLVESVVRTLQDFVGEISKNRCWDARIDPSVQTAVRSHLSELQYRFHPDQPYRQFLPGIPAIHTFAEFYIQTLRYRRLPPDSRHLLPEDCGPFVSLKRVIHLPSEPEEPDVEQYTMQQLESLVCYISKSGHVYPPGRVLHGTALSYLTRLAYDLPQAPGVHMAAILHSFQCCISFFQRSCAIVVSSKG